MANELMQGLLSNLLMPQQQQRVDPTQVMAAINSPNPMAAAMAYNLPGTQQVMGGMLKQVVGGRGGIGVGADEAMAQAMPKIDLTTSAGLQQAAQNALTTGNRPLALQLTLQAQETQKAERLLAQQTQQQQIQREAGTGTLKDMFAAAKTPEAQQIIQGLANAVATGAMTADVATTRAMSAIKQFEQPTTTAKDTVAIREWEYAKRNGYTGSFQDWKKGGSADRTSNYALMVQEGGGGPVGSLENQQQVNAYTQSLLRANNNETTPTEMISILNNDLNKIPSFANTVNDVASLARVKQTLPLLDESNPQAFTVISGAIPALYRNNSRAQSEIDRFRDSKGIAEGIGDWLTKVGGSTATKETKDNIKELVSSLETVLTQQRLEEVSRVANSYKGVFDTDVIERWQDNQLYTLDQEVGDIVDSYLGTGTK